MTPPAVADGLSSALRTGSSATFIYTMATIQASFANAAEFFNSLLNITHIFVARCCNVRYMT